MEKIKHEVITINNYKLLFGENKSQSKILLKENTNFLYTPIKIAGYSFSLNLNGTIDFGCQSLKIDDIKLALEAIKGEKNIKKHKWYIDDNGKKLVRADEVVEISFRFIITKDYKALKKPTLIRQEEFVDETKPMLEKKQNNSGWNSKLQWKWRNNYWIPGTDSDLINKFTYILEVYEALSNLKHQLQIK